MGVTVAGLPTQFLMERAFASQGLDWRAITVEVAEDRFETAIQGIAAMNFVALRLFPTLEAQGAERFLTQGSLEHFVGSVTSAALCELQWDAWNHVGYAIERLVVRRVAWEQCICWLHGNSVRTRSLVAALSTLEVRPRALVWSNAPQLDSATGPEKLQWLLGSETPTLLMSSIEDSVAFLQSQFENVSDELLGMLVLADDMAPEIEAQVVEAIHMFACGTKIICSGSAALQALASNGQDDSEAVELLSQAELTIAAEAYDFQRWTGYEIDSNLLRDAYDEYCDF
jgi:hypothetical protein